MRVQGILCFLVLLIAICEHQCATSTGATITSTIQDWDFDKNYYKLGDPNNKYYDNSRYNDDDPYGKKSSYKGKKDRSYNKQPSYNDKNDYSNEKKSYNDDDDDDDYKPSGYRSGGRRKSPDELGRMNIYFSGPSKNGKRKRPQRLQFPTARYGRDNFPLLGPFINFLPWLPIFADRLTKQTIIFSPIGGVYIIPPVINFYGEMFSIAELIATGYASLVSSGAPPPPAVDIAPLVQPGAVVGPGIPPVNTATGGFSGGVRTEFRKLDGPKPIKKDT